MKYINLANIGIRRIVNIKCFILTVIMLFGGSFLTGCYMDRDKKADDVKQSVKFSA